MSLFRSLSVLVVASTLSLASLAGCSSSTESMDSVASDESELKLANPRYLGQIASGETKTSVYTSPPAYRAYGFTAKGGDEITVDVKSVNGDAMGWISTAQYQALVSNDDASSSTLDSRVVYKVPAGTASRAYRAVFRDYDQLDATFKVSLQIKRGAAATCFYDDDTYKSGDTFASTDGCNTCSCTASGNVTCGKKVCACDPENEPWRNYVGTPTTCMTVRYNCSAGKHSFQNACGCGCERN